MFPHQLRTKTPVLTKSEKLTLLPNRDGLATLSLLCSFLEGCSEAGLPRGYHAEGCKTILLESKQHQASEHENRQWEVGRADALLL